MICTKKITMPTQQDLYLIADELRGIAVHGLRYAENEYDKERYEQILRVCARIIAAVDHTDAEELFTRFHDNLWHVSPVMCVESVVLRGGKILLIQRTDDQLWAIPGGLSEIGETVAQAAVRELWEEAGVRGQNPRLMGLFDSRAWQMRSKVHFVSAMFQLDTDDLPACTRWTTRRILPFTNHSRWISLAKTSCRRSPQVTTCRCP